MTPKKIISQHVLANMEMFAVTNPGMREALEKALVFYELSGSPNFYDDEECDDDEEILSAFSDDDEYDEYDEDVNSSF